MTTTLDHHNITLPTSWSTRIVIYLSQEVPRLIKSLEFIKAICLDKILVLDLKTNYLQSCQSCLATIWKRNVFQALSTTIQVTPCPPSQYYRFNLLIVISKLCDAVINKKVVDYLNQNKLMSDKQI